MENTTSVDIEHVGIDQDTEYAIEDVLTIAKSFGYGNFATATVDDKEYLPEGNIIAFLESIMEIAEDVLSKTKRPSQKYRLRIGLRKSMALQDKQAAFFAKHKKYLGFPTSPEGGLSEHLREGYSTIRV